jgi:hypothetical protein
LCSGNYHEKHFQPWRNKMTVPLRRSIATGAIGFALVSVCVFATVAFAERWMYRNLGVIGAYLAWTVLFILLSGAVFGTLVVGRWRLPKFYLLFALAFFAYAAAWMIAYFNLGRATGELVGSVAGSILMAIVFAAGFGALKVIGKLSAVLFGSNFIGYFLGSTLFFNLPAPWGMLLFGFVYGLFFGAGIGAALYLVQRENS